MSFEIKQDETVETDTCNIDQTTASARDLALSSEQISALELQNLRPVSSFRSNKFEKESKKHWDIFYKRNETRFFKDRHWTIREFVEICQPQSSEEQNNSGKTLVEIGCGVGNFAFPLLEDEENCGDLFIYACDFSPRAISLVKSHSLYNEDRIVAFTADVCVEDTFLSSPVPLNSADFASLMFVLSAIAPEKFETVIKNAAQVLRKEGLLFFRDYAVNDMAMFRFGPNSKISDRRYVRQDGTISYFFEKEEIDNIMKNCGFRNVSLEYVERRTINIKEGVNASRLFLQGKFRKL